MEKHIYSTKLKRRISRLGLGTGGRSSDRSIESEWVSALVRAFELGIRLIDTAEIYSGGFAEEIVGKAIKNWSGSREELFIVTKVHPSNLDEEKLRRSIRNSLSRLQLDYIDSYLIHWLEPTTDLGRAMKNMEKLWEEGLVLSIGVSNFSLKQIEEARSCLSHTDIAIVENRYSLMYRRDERDLLPYLFRENIIYLAYTPLEKGFIAKDQVLIEIGKKYNRTPIQIALNWYFKRGVIPIPRASSIPHVEELAGSLDFELSEKDFDYINKVFEKYIVVS